MKLRKGMILAAGFGKRMKPITEKIPKPLISFGGETILENCILTLKKFGVKKIIINIHYLSNKIENFIYSKKFDVDISLIKEKNTILDTGGGILNATVEFDDDPFIVLNPDTIWNSQHIGEFESLEKIYFDKNTAALLLVNKNKSFDKSFKGDFNINSNGLVSRSTSNQMIYTGAQIINRKIFHNHIIKPFSMNKIWDELIVKNALMGFESHQEFLHISTKEIYQRLVRERLTR